MNEWIIDGLVDCWSLCNLSQWENVTYINLDLSLFIFGDNEGNLSRIRKKDKVIHSFQGHLKDVKLMPFVFAFHFRIFIVNITEKTVCLIDPFEDSNSADTYLPLFVAFTQSVCRDLAFGKLRNVK